MVLDLGGERDVGERDGMVIDIPVVATNFK